MSRNSRTVLIYCIAAVGALVLGFSVVSMDMISLAIIGGVIVALFLPFFLKWHHVLLIVLWNASLTAFFLPGRPDMWIVIASASFGVVVLNYIVFQKPLLRASPMTEPVLVLTAVIFITAYLRGGIGIRALGGASFGGRYYIYEFSAVMGYFAFISERIPVLQATKWASWFFYSGTTVVLSNLVFFAGPSFYFLYEFIPTGVAEAQASAARGSGELARIEGLASAGLVAICGLMVRFGLRGLFDFSKPWRFLAFVSIVGLTFFAGFRSVLVLILIICFFQFIFEGLIRTRYFPIAIAVSACFLTPVFFFSSSMPSAVQRVISFMPVQVSEEVLHDAQSSEDWRFQMWNAVSKEIPQYFWLGKGHTVDPDAIYAANMADYLSLYHDPFEGSMVAGDYHNGPLSVIIPYGIFGLLSFIWVLIAGGRVLYGNFRYGDPKLRRINSVILSYYLAFCFSFFFIFGSLNSQLCLFLGLCGFSISLNGGAKKRMVRVPVLKPAVLRLKPAHMRA